jgi:hypothetical protein
LVLALSQLAKRSRRVDSREIARKALLRLLEPLAGFVLDSGLSVHDLAAIFREAAVRSAATQQLELYRRLNISGIAASTGISRAATSRILKSASKATDQKLGQRQQSTKRVLAAWHQNPNFTNTNGHPADLKLYGRGATFEGLVRRYGGGIPTRAMLDELTRTGAIEISASQLVRMKSLVAVERGVTPQVIKAFGDRATELLSTLLHNMRNPQASVFVANVSETGISREAMPLIRKELATRGANFLADIGDLLVREPASGRPSGIASQASNVSVTVFLRESREKTKSGGQPSRKRRNFRRDK